MASGRDGQAEEVQGIQTHEDYPSLPANDSLFSEPTRRLI